MPEPAPRDQLATESLEPAENLTSRRNDRDEADYRDYCEATLGMVELGAEILHPADVLDKCAPDAARRGRAEAKEQIRGTIEQEICELFPAPVAIPFHRFLEGPAAPLRRIHHLRDTWEALVRLLAALALGEAACHSSVLAPLELREGESQNYRACRRPDLRSDRLSVRIGIVEGVLRRADRVGVPMDIAALLPIDIVAEIRRLNVVRNGFSHDAAKSDKQAQKIIDDAYPALLEVLVDVRSLKDVELFRVSTITPRDGGADVEIERLVGHAQSQRFRTDQYEGEALDVAMTAADVGGLHRVLAQSGTRPIDLSPFVYSIEDGSGHRTRLLEFKGRHRDKWHLECVAESTTDRVPAAPHDALLARFDDLLASAGE